MNKTRPHVLKFCMGCNMKKKILCLVLSLLILPCALLFTACKEESYNLKDLNEDYVSIAEKYNAITIENNSLKLDYSIFKLADGTQYVNETFKLAPYNVINNYNNILNNMLQIVADKINNCSIETEQINDQTKNDVKQKLNNLDAAFSSINVEVNNFANQIRLAQEIDDAETKNTELTKANSVYLMSFKYLLNSYNNLFNATYYFSTAVANIHFTLANVESNDVFVNTPFNKEQLTKLLSMLDSRLKLQKANCSFVYVLENLIDNNFAKSVETLGAEAGSMPNYETYTTDIANITKEIDVSKEYIDAVEDEQLGNIFDKAAVVYNLQASLNISCEGFLKSLNDINYERILNNKSTASSYELSCLDIINNYISLIKANNTALKDLINLL